VISAISAATFSAKPSGVFSPVPTAVPPCASSIASAAPSTRSMPFRPAGVAGELLAQRQRRGVLRVGAADLDDVRRRPWPWRPAPRAAASAPAAAGRHAPVSPRRCAWRSGRCRWTTGPCCTWSLGWTGSFEPISPPSISMARLEITSLAFMFDWVPEPVCQTTSGKWSSSLPSITSCAAGDNGLAELRVELAEAMLASAAGLLDDAEARTTAPAAFPSRSGNSQRALGLRAPVPSASRPGASASSRTSRRTGSAPALEDAASSRTTPKSSASKSPTSAQTRASTKTTSTKSKFCCAP
jgi:hypothetical protein